MRIWSLHPRYLDPQGLVALWRETLLAQAVLQGKTRGYLNHPQLARFRAQRTPLAAIGSYLAAVSSEATARGYAFDRTKIALTRPHRAVPVTQGQLLYEWQHLLGKLSQRNAELHRRWRCIEVPACHPLFEVRPGGVEPWERPQAAR
jgi:hypothetical protein